MLNLPFGRQQNFVVITANVQKWYVT